MCFVCIYDTSFIANVLVREILKDYWIWAIGTCLIPSLALLVKVKKEALQVGYRWSSLFCFLPPCWVCFLEQLKIYLSAEILMI